MILEFYTTPGSKMKPILTNNSYRQGDVLQEDVNTVKRTFIYSFFCFGLRDRIACSLLGGIIPS